MCHATWFCLRILLSQAKLAASRVTAERYCRGFHEKKLHNCTAEFALQSLIVTVSVVSGKCPSCIISVAALLISSTGLNQEIQCMAQAVSALILAICTWAVHENRFVLSGHCWLNGHSETFSLSNKWQQSRSSCSQVLPCLHMCALQLDSSFRNLLAVCKSGAALLPQGSFSVAQLLLASLLETMIHRGHRSDCLRPDDVHMCQLPHPIRRCPVCLRDHFEQKLYRSRTSRLSVASSTSSFVCRHTMSPCRPQTTFVADLVHDAF